MIDERRVKRYCSEDISRIENYDKAINDKTQIWDCHHRDEIRELPSGMVAIRSKAELIENGRYYDCPANELIFLTHSEHARIHNKGANNYFYGKPAWSKGKTLSDEHRAKMAEARRKYWEKKRANKE